MATGGPGVKAAGGAALDGAADDWNAFLQDGQYKARNDDNRVLVSRLLGSGGPNVRKLAGQAMDGTDADIQEFLDHGWAIASARDQETLTVAELAAVASHAQKQAKKLTETAKDEDLRVRVSTVMATGGPGVKAAGGAALDGAADDWNAFLQDGQYKARNDDNRVLVSRLLGSGGPNVRKLAGQA
ncbi:ALF repeat-containing protein, partial [Streptomyces sp. EN16]|uniref:ALF repeat-containing protein n=1 Tax=Streptomyces sp. EN16 TaxID=212773 RepID=UPI000A6CDE84